MHLKRLEIIGFKSFAKKSVFEFNCPVSAVVGPNGSGKSNVVEAIRFVLGEQSLKSLRGKRGEDLIFNGSKTIHKMWDAKVSLVFDNSERDFNIDFGEVIVGRQVHRDGANKYFINNSQVRLRDIYELLAPVNIGASGHHIISQGEADRILSVPPKERKTMIEDALGLKIYQWKIKESKRKLEKTNENIRETEILRREIAPHLKFLKKQVEKLERAFEMREELKSRYLAYFSKENDYIQKQMKILKDKRSIPEKKLTEIEKKLENITTSLSNESNINNYDDKIKEIRRQISNIRAAKDLFTRKIGKIEGLIEYHESKKEEDDTDIGVTVSYKKVNELLSRIEEESVIEDGNESILRGIIERIVKLIKEFKTEVLNTERKESSDTKSNNINELKKEKETLSNELIRISEKEEKLLHEDYKIKKEVEESKFSSLKSEREMFDLKSQKTEVSSLLHDIASEEEKLFRDERDFKEELNEALVLVGEDVKYYTDMAISEPLSKENTRKSQEDERKAIERIKIRLEDMGGAGSSDEIMKEYEETEKRDRFLESEIEDMKKSASSLLELIIELTEKINSEFEEGLVKINKKFLEFFGTMFGGGSASLSLVTEKKRKRSLEDELLMEKVGDEEDEEEIGEGIEVEVKLPHKKIKGLVMLSGGERALTSIALLFAMSQVKPPPFLVLDETDAALDEANSRKYGDMISNLAELSQLIVVTHNRETMSRAGILYGVTMGSDAVSKTLSVKFDEAVSIAK